MSKVHRAAACISLSLAILVPASLVTATADSAAPDATAQTDDGSSSRAARARETEARLDAASVAGPSFRSSGYGEFPPFIGIDGQVHESAPGLVEGFNDTIYFGQEFDGACYWGHRFPKALAKLGKLADVIERSGREVVFTVAPNKSSANKVDLPFDLPHGRCDRVGIAQQDKVLDTWEDSRYLPLRVPLARNTEAGGAMYWKIDTHWTTVGGTTFARELARRLDPKVAILQRYRAAEETISVDFNAIGLLDGVQETGPAKFPTTRVRTRPTHGSVAFDPVNVSPYLQWANRPARRTVAGTTLIVGDSFAYRAMPSLLPLFEHGRFIWPAPHNLDLIARAIKKSDTVVLEVVQRYLPSSAVVSVALRRAVADELR